MANVTVNPAYLVAGTIGIPVALGALGRTFITPKAQIANEAEASEEFRRLTRNFAIFNGIAAVGLGYATSRRDLSDTWRSVALGGAIGTGLLAAILGGALLTGPSPAEARPPQQPPVLPTRGVAAAASASPTFVSNLIGYPR